MTSDARELSLNEGEPIGLFQFVRGAIYWRYTSADRDIVHDGQTFISAGAAISRSKIQQGGERRKLTLTVTMPSDLPVTANWRPYPPGDAIVLTILVKHAGETDALVDWVGRVVGSAFKGAMLELTSEPTQTHARRIGLKRCWQRGCPHALYSIGFGLCNVSRDDHALPAVLTGVDGITLNADEFGSLPDGRLAGGYVEWTQDDGLIARRSIETHAGTLITIEYATPDLVSGFELIAYPGCNHADDCWNYYNNGDNYGGDPYMPERSPFDGNPVW